MRPASILLASAALAASLGPVARAQGYGQPYPLNQAPQPPGYQAPGYQPPAYQPSYQLPAPQAVPGQSGALDSREAIALQNQLLELRRDLQALQSQRGFAPPPAPRSGRSATPGEGDLLPQLLERVAALEDEVRRLRGQVEDAQNQVQRQQRDFGKQLGDLQFRLQNGTGAAAPSAPPEPEQQPVPRSRQGAAVPAPAPTPRRTPELAMQEGNAALARRDYAAAEAGAREVLGNGRAGPRAGDAQMLLAQSLAGKRDYQGAAVAYGDAYQRLKAGTRGQDALLGLATSLSNLGEKQAACGALDQLRTNYPSARRDVRDAAADVRGRAGCR